MNNARSRFAVFAVLTLDLGMPAPAQQVFTERESAAANDFLRARFAKSESGMVIGLLDSEGSRVLSAGKFGNGNDRPVDGDTVFGIASVTKVFTVLLALDSASRGEVKLDDPVSKYLPQSVKMPALDGKEITLRDLAAQDSGLPFHHGDFNDWEKKGYTIQDLKKASEALTATDFYSFLSSYKLTTVPGTQFGYSNPGMALLAHAIELQTGEKYESLAVERICRPLGMESTRITLTPELRARLATGHLVDGRPSENIKLQIMQGAGSLLSTTHDLLKFLAANLGFTQSTVGPLLQEMQAQQHSGSSPAGNTSMPWMDRGLYQPPKSRLLGHGGGGFGYAAFIGFDTLKRRGVVVLSNQMAVNSEGVGWAILQGMTLSHENVTYFVREIVGLGVALDADKATGMLRITSVYPKSPAGKTGLTSGLVIQEINGVSVKGKSVQECLGLMGGEIGTKVRFEVFDPESKETKAVELTRQKFVTTTG